jgi:hypothetical protein
MKREEQIRKKAKELGQQYFPDSSNIWARSNVEACYVENACVEMAEWLDQHPHWIPVEEMLPKVGEPVWFYTPSMDEPLKGAYQENGTWYSVEYECKFINGVTHWMPMPVPPRKEVNNDKG